MGLSLSTKKNQNYTFVIDGASGFLGYQIAKFFSKNNKIILISRSPKLEYIRQDILANKNVEYYSDYRLIPSINNEKKIFIHTACSTPNNNYSGYQDIFSKNLEIRNKVCQHLQNSEYELLVNISSMSVYGLIKNKILFEDHQTLPTNLYGLSKLLAENEFSLISKFSNITNIIHLRLPGIISKEAKGIFVASLIQKIKENKPIKVCSKNSMFNNATTAFDICRTIENFIKTYEKLPNEVFLNMSSKDSLSISEIILYLSNKLEKSFPELIEDKEISSFLIKNKHSYNLLNNSLLLNMLEEILEGN